MDMDYQIIAVPMYDGTGRSTRAVQVFDCDSGETISVTRFRPFESKSDWISRAFANARELGAAA